MESIITQFTRWVKASTGANRSGRGRYWNSVGPSLDGALYIGREEGGASHMGRVREETEVGRHKNVFRGLSVEPPSCKGAHALQYAGANK